MPEDPKFIYVVLCFIVALGSYFLCRDKRDWAWLAGGMAFTVGADCFLVLRDAHIPGVSVFCFAHACYMMRAVRWPWKRVVIFFLIIGCAVSVMVLFGLLTVLVGLYAALFIASITANVRYRKSLPNAPLVLTGLVLFALCDIGVLLYNIPRYAGGYAVLARVYPFIWLFYLPAQSLLALSAADFKPLAKEQIP
jgi:hypothetical protein